jgi:hypothetical protein
MMKSDGLSVRTKSPMSTRPSIRATGLDLAMLLTPVHNYGLREVFEKARSISQVFDTRGGIAATIVRDEDRYQQYRIHFRADEGSLVDRVEYWPAEAEATDSVIRIVAEFSGVYLPASNRSWGGEPAKQGPLLRRPKPLH